MILVFLTDVEVFVFFIFLARIAPIVIHNILINNRTYLQYQLYVCIVLFVLIVAVGTCHL